MGIRGFFCVGYGGKWVRFVFFVLGTPWGSPARLPLLDPWWHGGWGGLSEMGERVLKAGGKEIWSLGNGSGGHFAGANSPKAAASGPLYDKPTYRAQLSVSAAGATSAGLDGTLMRPLLTVGLDEQRHNKVNPRERHQGLAEKRQPGGRFRSRSDSDSIG
jgi:hypothetical protein